MIDLHCHFLPGIDDGAKTMEEALNLARASVKNGIECAIMTPHLHPGRYENIKASIATSTQEFRNALKKARIPLQIGYAAEVRLAPETLPLIESGQVPFLGEVEGYQLMLLEFPHSHIPLGADKLVDRLLDKKIRPIIAHPERNKDVMRDLDKITPFIEMGCLLQLTAASIVNRFGDNAHTRAVELLQSDAALVIATDAHNLKSRPPILREAMEAASEIIGHNAAHDMVYRVPQAIVASQFAKPDAAEMAETAGESSKVKGQRREAPAAKRRGITTPPETVKQAERAGPKSGQPRETVIDQLEARLRTDLEAQLQDTLQQHLDETIPKAIEAALTNKLTQDLDKELIPGIRQDVEASLKTDLTERMANILTEEYRTTIAAELIESAKQAAALEIKDQFKNEIQQELLQKLHAQREEHQNLTHLLDELIGLFRTSEGAQKTEAPAPATTLQQESK